MFRIIHEQQHLFLFLLNISCDETPKFKNRTDCQTLPSNGISFLPYPILLISLPLSKPEVHTFLPKDLHSPRRNSEWETFPYFVFPVRQLNHKNIVRNDTAISKYRCVLHLNGGSGGWWLCLCRRSGVHVKAQPICNL